MELKLKKLLEEKGKSVYWLIKETGISHRQAYDLVNGNTKGIQFETLERLCNVLSCTPNDIFGIK